MTPLEWAKCTLVLRSCYPTSFRLDSEALAVWYEMLCDLSFEDVALAVRHMAKTQKAFPSIADIRAIAQPQQVTDDLIWNEVLGYCNSAHVYGPLWRNGEVISYEWSDPELGKLVVNGFDGGREIANASPERLGFIKAQLLKMWASKKASLSKSLALDSRSISMLKQIGEGL